MTPDELRALADALEPMARAPRFEDFDVPGFCAWVRACADAQPVRAVPIGHALSAVRHVGSANYPDRERAAIERLYSAEFDAYTRPAPAAPQAEQPIDLDAVAMQQMRQAAAESTWMPSEYTSNDWIADVCRWLRDGPPAAAPQAEPSAALIRAYNSGYMQGHHDTVEAQFIVIHPLDMDTYHADVVAELGLTAAPQAEPCIGNDSACPCQDGDACHYKDAADGTKAWPVPQAEPKREPLSDERIDAALQSDPAMVLALMSGEMTVGEFKAALRRLARTVERAHEIGGSDAE